MSIRTDLAIEANTNASALTHGIEKSEHINGSIKTTVIKIKEKSASQRLSRPTGVYITLEFPPPDRIADFEPLKLEIISSLKTLLPSAQRVLVVGLGNEKIVSDSIGPKTAEKLLATRHIAGGIAESLGLTGLKSVSVIRPDVLGNTGIEAAEIVEGIVKKIKPDAVIAIDALAAADSARLFRTIQLCDSGISPGSGVKNSRKELSCATLGLPVIALGVPTVVDIASLTREITGKAPQKSVDLVLTPKDADILTHRISEALAEALNIFLHPEADREILLSLV